MTRDKDPDPFKSVKKKDENTAKHRAKTTSRLRGVFRRANTRRDDLRQGENSE